jgi:hypothetical protein
MAQDADRSHFRLPIAGCREHYFGWIGGFSSETYQAVGFSSDRSTPAPQGLETHAKYLVPFTTRNDYLGSWRLKARAPTANRPYRY